MGPGQYDSTMSTNNKETLWAVPKLAADGSNWVTFKTWFLFAMAGCDVDGHFDGSDTPPPAPTYTTLDETKWTTADHEKNQAYLSLAKRWKHDEHVTCAQLAQVMSDSLLIRTQHAGMVANMWNTVVTEFDRKGRMVQVDLCRRMMEK